MNYYIYENWQAGPHKAVLHEGSCSYCRDGRGRGAGHDPCHARWHGPFASLDSARRHQAALEVRVRRECRFCMNR